MYLGNYFTVPARANLPGQRSTGGDAFEYTAIDNSFSMEFDGVSSHILTDLTPDSHTSFSISAWVYADSLGSYNGVASQYRAGTPASSAWFLETIGSNMAFGVANGGTLQYATKAFSKFAWHHIAGVWNGTEVEVYIDGAASGSPVLVSAMNTGTVNMAIGGIWNSGGTEVDNGIWDGKIDELATWSDVALSESTIQAIYDTTANNPGKVADLSETPEGQPAAWYRMGD